MARVRHIEIKNFRGIKELSWHPCDGLNCLIGPGDSGKSTILDAIDLCLGARRNISFCDADFHLMNEAEAIVIAITIGELPDALKSMEAYGPYLRNYDKATGKIDDEPEAGGEVALTVLLTVASDLEPVWSLHSERGGTSPRYLTGGDRDRLVPTRLTGGGLHLGWRRGSILSKIADEKANVSNALADAARHARMSFGDHAAEQLEKTLKTVEDTAKSLGVGTGVGLRALLDAQSISFGSGAMSIHDQNGIPLSAMGTGSIRLLTAGLQRSAAKEASIVLIDELELGLEPHRILRLLGSLGAKDNPAPLQGFLTTHSPVVVRELAVGQLHLVRQGDKHSVVVLPEAAQSTARRDPEAFLAASIIVCEGASEVGFIRGLERHLAKSGESMFAGGLALVDGGGCNNIYRHAGPLLTLGYRTAVLRDDDRRPEEKDERTFQEGGGKLFAWREGRALEDELFASLSDEAVLMLLERAIALHDEPTVASQISSHSEGQIGLADCLARRDETVRRVLAKASKSRANGWYKNVGDYEDLVHDIVIPDLKNSDPGFKQTVVDVVQWVRGAD